MKGQKCLKYCPELNAITGSVTASLLLCQLEYWFHKTKGEAFYKFLEPCEHRQYRSGDSWTEEMRFSRAEFRKAFGRIGIVYKSKRAYVESKDPFQGKLYLAYYDRIKKLTFYMRNPNPVHNLLRKPLSALGYYKEYPSSSSSSSSSKEDQTTSLTQEVLNLFAVHCPSLTPPAHLSHKLLSRIKALVSLLAQKGQETLTTVLQVFQQVEVSDFLCGRLTTSHWQAHLEWIVQPTTFFAILAGKYAPFKRTPYQNLVTAAQSAASVSCALPASLPRHLISSTFHRVESHHFDMAQLEAMEHAHHVAQYEAQLAKRPV